MGGGGIRERAAKEGLEEARKAVNVLGSVADRVESHVTHGRRKTKKLVGGCQLQLHLGS